VDLFWPVQDAKQRFSELLRRTEAEGPQFVTRHGKEVAVMLDIDTYRALTGQGGVVDFKKALAGSTPLDDDIAAMLGEPVAERDADLPREVDLMENQ
jgi:prevent-host-death family protein